MSEEIKLPEHFNDAGFQMALVLRTGDCAIYSQSKFGRIIAWEVIKIVHKPDRTLFNGKVILSREKYPSPSEWGKSAWSCASLERARQKLAWLTERKNK